MEKDYELVSAYGQPAENDFRLYQFYYFTRVLFLFTTHTLGPLAIICILKRDCKNTYRVILVIISGIILKCFNFLETAQVSRNVEKHDKTSQQCVDFNPPCTLVTGLTGLMVILGIIDASFELKKRNEARYFQRVLLIYICSCCSCIAYLYATSESEMLQSPIYETENDVFYLSLCLTDPFEDPIPLLSEYGFLVIPFSSVIILYVLRRRSDTDSLMILVSCHEDPSMVCTFCECINYCFCEILWIYCVGYLFVRPMMLYYSFNHHMNIRDVVPPVVNILAHLVISFRCIMTVRSNRSVKPKKSLPYQLDRCRSEDEKVFSM